MSYDTNLYVGWYVEFKPSTRKAKTGEVARRYCPTSKKHPTGDSFCPKCGAKIEERLVDEYDTYANPYHLQFEEDEDELKEMTLGRVSLKDMKDLALMGKYRVICPEFMPSDSTVIVIAPGFKGAADIGRSDGMLVGVDMENNPRPTEEWIAQVKKVFDVEDVKVGFGAVVEVV